MNFFIVRVSLTLNYKIKMNNKYSNNKKSLSQIFRFKEKVTLY